MKVLLICTALLVLVYSCKKNKQDEIVKPETILFGKWNWKFSYKINNCESYYIVLDSTTEGVSYQLELSQEHLKLFMNESLVETHTIEYLEFSYPEGQGIAFSNDKISCKLRLDNDTEKIIYGSGTLKSMKLSKIIDMDSGCYRYREYFRKEY